MSNTRNADKKVKKKTSKRNIPDVIVHITASFNNTIISISDIQGNVFAQGSAAASGFKGARKSTPHAAAIAMQETVEKAMQNFGVKNASVRVSGPGQGRESAIRALKGKGVNVSAIIDVTPIPHNGCKPPKKKRV